jgi:hypothetical protein
MTFIRGPKCEAYCLALNLDHKVVQNQAAVWYQHR